MSEQRLAQWQPLRDYCQKLFVAQGMPADEAFLVADSLVDADLNGVDSHGVSRVPIYMKRLEEKVVEKACRIETEREFPGSLALNAHNSMGIVAGVRAMEMGIKKAKESGFVLVTVNHSNHFGTAAYFAKMALEHRMIGFAATNAPSTMAPWGGIQPYLGTNPFAVAIPAGREHPVVMDMATSVVAQGKIIMAAKKNEPIPAGWAITKDGRPTTDPAAALEGSVLPFGGPKGYAIALLIDILSGILSGATFGPHLNNMWNDFTHPQNVGHCFGALDIAKFTDPDQFLADMDRMIGEIKSAPAAQGVDEIFLPGEIERRKSEQRRSEGIPLTPVVYEDLRKLGEKWQVPFWE